jgi:hypothetical protein
MRVRITNNFFLIIYIFLINCTTSLPAQDKGGRWQFEYNGEDSAQWDSKSNTGILAGAGAFQSEPPLAEGTYYLSLEDENNYCVFTVPDDDELDFTNENLAISVWVYPLPTSFNPQFLIIKGDRSGSVKTDNYTLRLYNGYLEFMVHNEAGIQTSIISSFPVPTNQWTYLGIFYDFNNKIIYLWNNPDTAPIDTRVFDAQLFPNADPLYIGTAGENGFKRFLGRLDDVRIGSQIEDIQPIPVKIKENENRQGSKRFLLYQNFPNPFNTDTQIDFDLTRNSFIKLEVFNFLGQKITTLAAGYLMAGHHSISFDAGTFPSGIYFYRLKSENYMENKRMILIK